MLFTSYSDINMHLSLSLLYTERLLRFWSSCRFERKLLEQIMQIFSHCLFCALQVDFRFLHNAISNSRFICFFMFMYLFMRVWRIYDVRIWRSLLRLRNWQSCLYRFSDLWVDGYRVACVTDSLHWIFAWHGVIHPTTPQANVELHVDLFAVFL